MTAPIQSSHVIPTAPDTKLEVLTSIPVAGSIKPTLLFVHFWGGSARTFGALAALLSPDFPLVRPSLRGWGASTGPADPDAYGITDSADDIAALVAHLRADAALAAAGFFQHGLVIVGHSMGAKIAQVLTARGDLGALLKGLVLIGPAPLGRLELPAEMREQQIAMSSSRESVELVLRHVVLGSDVGTDELRHLVNDFVGGREQAKLAWPKYAMMEDYGGLASKEGVEGLKIPIAVVVGGLDKIETAEGVDERVVQVLKKAGASVKMTVLDGVGHLMPVEAPKELENIIRNFVHASS
ncbi:Alpha/Beta hydrolase protein [Mycena rosella]|uniref:Alpha/Beta hydrolase protein n=1 Tax=Mycena rosella TaxID=1033263 RepID=A0AAD7M771_MYCRO|nr:Alpha/Beta hydrolase protein [Mycena rosella]